MMASKRLLLLSNSTNFGEGYLDHALGSIRDFLGRGVKEVLFIPYAGVTIAWDTYASKVAERYKEIGYDMTPIHKTTAADAVANAQAIAVGGGNTFHLLKTMYDNNIVDAIRERVLNGCPYMGWSAGSNVAGPTICTTNDMPIVEPPSFTALDLVPFQLNPHYTDARLPNHGGETRADRLAEFVESNPGKYVVGLKEGSILRVEGTELSLLGDHDARIFRKGDEIRDVKPSESLQFLTTG